MDFPLTFKEEENRRKEMNRSMFIIYCVDSYDCGKVKIAEEGSELYRDVTRKSKPSESYMLIPGYYGG